MLSRHAGATAVRFHTRPLADDEANRLHEDLGSWVPVLDVWLAVTEGSGCVGAVAPVDTADAPLERLMARLRSDPRILPATVAVGRFPPV
jgi:hypothetical protein